MGSHAEDRYVFIPKNTKPMITSLSEPTPAPESASQILALQERIAAIETAFLELVDKLNMVLDEADDLNGKGKDGQEDGTAQ